MNHEQKYTEQSQSYRRGFVEGQSGERNAYLLEDGTEDTSEYERGFADGLLEFRKKFECDVCGNYPNEDGDLEHGRGCYVLSEDGGGSQHFPEVAGAARR